MANMKKFGTQGDWQGIVNGTKQVVSVVGTYGGSSTSEPHPIVRIFRGPDHDKTFAINWETGEVIKEIKYKD